MKGQSAGSTLIIIQMPYSRENAGILKTSNLFCKGHVIGKQFPALCHLSHGSSFFRLGWAIYKPFPRRLLG